MRRLGGIVYFLQPPAQRSQSPPQVHLFFFAPRTAKTTHTVRIANTITVAIPSPHKRQTMRNAANAARYATQHWLTATLIARHRLPSSRRMAAMAATQGV